MMSEEIESKKASSGSSSRKTTGLNALTAFLLLATLTPIFLSAASTLLPGHWGIAMLPSHAGALIAMILILGGVGRSAPSQKSSLVAVMDIFGPALVALAVSQMFRLVGW